MQDAALLFLKLRLCKQRLEGERISLKIDFSSLGLSEFFKIFITQKKGNSPKKRQKNLLKIRPCSEKADKYSVKVSILSIFIWVSLWGPLGHAQNAPPVQEAPWLEMASDAHLKLRLYSTLKLTQKKLDSSLTELQSQSLPEDEFLDAWSKEFRRITQDYVQLQMEQSKWDTRQISAVKRKLSKLNWHAFGKMFLSQTKHLKTFLRHKGPSLFSVLVLTNILQLIFPFILGSLGYNPLWAAILLKIPTTLPVVYSYQLISHQFYKLRLTQELGSKKAYQEFVELNKASLNGLNMKHIQDHILPLDAQGDAVVIKRPRPVLHVLQMLGLKKETMTLYSARRFMIENEIDDPLAWGLVNDDQLTTQDRLAMLVTHFHDELPPKQMAKFRLRFAESFTTLRNAPVEWRSTYNWVEKVLRSQSTQDIFESLQEMPDHLRPQELSEVWDQVLLTELAKGEQLSYRQIRSLINGFHSFKVKTYKLSQAEMTTELKEEFLSYFKNALSPSTRNCFNTHEQVLQRLMAL